MLQIYFYWCGILKLFFLHFFFRKNPEHKASFSHLGDSDYDTDPDDVRPSCSYGNTCYRRNPAHRRDFKHPSNGGNVQGATLRSRIYYSFNKCVCHFHTNTPRFMDSDSD